MLRLSGTAFLAAGLVLAASTTRGDDAQVNQVLDKAIKALGGEEKLSKAHAICVKGKGKLIIDGNENDIKSEATVQGLDHYATKFEGDFGGNHIEGRSVLSEKKGWRKFGDNVMEMDDDAVKNEKRTIYLMLTPTTILPLKSKDFKVESAADETVDGKPAATLKVTGPDGKDFKISFDKESGLPVRTVAKVLGFQGDEYTQETLYKEYKDFDGIKKATKMTVKRDGEDFVLQEVTEFKAIEKAPEGTFDELK
ncbi:hypothetical protein OJF2_23120 [Aquisphaera giovannonii]|uniref:Lipoprotein chaperone n=1 Tax=Aquisphaera giovannonii TaxID=406548 RepID=A0A5B9VZV7_9BACT|nr:hypothetical protein [Aquisphaera giovannonii]QEH33783.1 hypothetical protein OJF2_23120 [Aquisphaera giovannonii]